MAVATTTAHLELDRVLAEAGKHRSLASLSRACQVQKPNTFRDALASRGWLDQVKQALARPDLPTVVSDGLTVDETEILRQENAELKAALRKDRKHHVYDERVARAVENACAVKQPRFRPAQVAPSGKTPHEFALLFSDLHAGEIVSREETGGLNFYNWDVMLERLNVLREGIVSYQQNRPYPVEKLNIWALGDMLSGNIHAELEATNEIPLAEATVQLGLDMAVWVESLTEFFPQVTFDGVVGNHPRAHKKPWAKQGYDNADWTAYHVMATALKRNPAIKVTIPKATQHRVPIAGKHALLWHGDGVRSSMPGVPWGGVMRRVAALSNQYASAAQPVDYFACGHFHQANAVEAGRVLMNGSIKGVDEYSLKAFGGGQGPKQMLATFHPHRGLTDVSIIDCDVK